MRDNFTQRIARLRKDRFGHHTSIFVVAIGMVMLAAPQPLTAQPLTLNACLSLWRQTTAAKANGLDALMASGAEGAATRLSKGELAQIKSHIGLVERLKFQCRRFVPPPPGTDAP